MTVSILLKNPVKVIYVENKDSKTVIGICTPEINETVKIASSLKFN